MINNYNSEKDRGYYDKLRHTCSHLLAAAVLELYPKAKPTIGPPIEDGFYYDFEFETPISENDLPAIEEKMITLVKDWHAIEKKEVNHKEALIFFKQNQYKIELIEELNSHKEKITLYKSGQFTDLCRGGHVAKPDIEIRYFKLLKTAGAYWRGNENNIMLTRIYGTCFPTHDELKKYLYNLEEAKKRDHKKLGKLLDLYIISDEVGPGLLIWTPNGSVIRREIEKFITSEQTKRGYQHVFTPHIGRKSLWQTSGHWDLYRDKMYSPIKIDKDEYLVKPMNCPFHMMIYKNKPHSYRELPIRIAEDASVYRYEQAGELSGMTRVRYITQDDSHIFCTKEQVVSEFVKVQEYIVFLLKAFKINDFSFRLSLRDPANKNKYLGEDKIWEEAQISIEKAVKLTKVPFYIKEGEAAFYGPKLDVMIKDALGREWQCGTIQIDFMLPERFKLEYIDKAGMIQRPALIHRAPLGSLERFTGILIEHYGGSFPLWLSPVQVTLLPVSAKHAKFAQKAYKFLSEQNIRCSIDTRNESLPARIRDHALQKTPYMGIIGDKEIAGSKNSPGDYLISVRKRGEKITYTRKLGNFLKELSEEIQSKK